MPTAYCLLSAVCCLLLTVCCLLPAAYCLLLTVCCLLPAAYCSCFALRSTDLPRSRLVCVCFRSCSSHRVKNIRRAAHQRGVYVVCARVLYGVRVRARLLMWCMGGAHEVVHGARVLYMRWCMARVCVRVCAWWHGVWRACAWCACLCMWVEVCLVAWRMYGWKCAW